MCIVDVTKAASAPNLVLARATFEPAGVASRRAQVR